ncbi:MAG: sulfatase-like hydrolase/transferase [Clostridiales bacterium]|jgi:arylsulfatase A-like enzyme|nr:sulfatase-like hydrolase/transferase [Clostridiales bacterium]
MKIKMNALKNAAAYVRFNCKCAFAACIAVMAALLAFGVGGSHSGGSGAAASQKAKNVLMIQTDHELFYKHGTDEDVFKIKRPVYDQFRSEAVQFANARSICPLCSPARRAMLTAVYPQQSGIMTNATAQTPLPVETMYDVLLGNNFSANNIYFYGKTHYSGDKMPDDNPVKTYGVQGWAEDGYGQPYTTQRYAQYLRDNNYFGAPSGLRNGPVMILEADSLSPGGSPYKGETFKLADMGIITGNQFGIAVTPKEYHEAYFLADLASSGLRRIASRSSRDPFVMSVNIWGPHHPYYPTPEYADLYRDADGVLGGDIPEYPTFYDDYYNKPAVYAWDNQVQSGANPGMPAPNTRAWEDFRAYMALAYAQATMVDDAIGGILDTLKETGLDEDTVVIWTNDHGDALGSHGGHSDKECYLTEEILAVNMTMRHPDFPELKGTANAAYVTTVDVPVTILDVVGMKFNNPDVSGISLAGLLSGAQKPRDYLTVVTNGHYSDTRARGLYYDGYIYSYYMDDIDELYDLKNDPFEKDNLIFEPSAQGRVALMKTMLREWQVRYKDNIPLVNL